MGLILPDTSVWIPYFRSQLTDIRVSMRELMQSDLHDVAICPPVRMELRFGTDDLARRRIERILDGLPDVTMAPDDDFELAGDIYHDARQFGRTVRSPMDCLIAAIAIRAEAELVHADRDFDVIGELYPELHARRLD